MRNDPADDGGGVCGAHFPDARGQTVIQVVVVCHLQLAVR